MLLVAALLGTGCGTPRPPISDTPYVTTSTLPPTLSPTRANPSESVPATATHTPIQGATSTRVNVRKDPSSASPPIGVIDAYAYVQIVARDPSGSWYQIQFPAGEAGLGWVTSQYVNVQGKDDIPTIARIAGSGPGGVILQQVNVRSGPGTDADTLGTLNPRDLVSVLGKDPTGLWLQIQYAGSSAGTGWVAAGYVQSSGLDQLPVIGQTGEVIGTETPTGVPPTPIATPGIAAADDDSLVSPGADVTFSPVGSGSLIYSSDLSAPAGDAADWVRFSPDTPRSTIRLACTGTASVTLSVLADGIRVAVPHLPACGDAQVLTLIPAQRYTLELSASAHGGQQSYARYTLTIVSLP